MSFSLRATTSAVIAGSLALSWALPLHRAEATQPDYFPPKRTTTFHSPHDSTPPPKRVYVNSVEDFVHHMEAHVERVEILGVEIFQQYRADFPGVDLPLLRSFLRLHDQSKTNPRFSRNRTYTIAEQLYENYGVNFAGLSPETIARAKKLVDELNRVDAGLAQDFFRAHGLLKRDGSLTPVAESLLKIEKIADQVDRYMCPVSEEEFAKKMKPASEFMNAPESKKIALVFEDRHYYEALVADSTYPSYVARKIREHRANCYLRSLRAVAGN